VVSDIVPVYYILSAAEHKHICINIYNFSGNKICRKALF